MITVSTTWITPFEAAMSGLMTLASLIFTLLPSALMRSIWPFTVLDCFNCTTSARLGSLHMAETEPTGH